MGTIKTALRVPTRDFHDTIRAFGFGRTTGVDLPGRRGSARQGGRDMSNQTTFGAVALVAGALAASTSYNFV